MLIYRLNVVLWSEKERCYDRCQQLSRDKCQNVTKITKFIPRHLGKNFWYSRTTLTHIESGSGNPSLSNLIKIATGLRVTVEELVSPPFNPVQLIPASELPQVSQAKGMVTITKILPESSRGFAIDKVLIKGPYRMKGSPHKKGTKEYLCCLKGKMSLFTEGEKFSLKTGDLLIFPGDQHHSYFNDAKSDLEFISIVSLPSSIE